MTQAIADGSHIKVVALGEATIAWKRVVAVTVGVLAVLAGLAALVCASFGIEDFRRDVQHIWPDGGAAPIAREERPIEQFRARRPERFA